MEKKHIIGKKWRKVFSYTLWMFEYYTRRTRNELQLDEIDAMIFMGLRNVCVTSPDKITLNEDQMKFFLVMVDYTNKKLLNELEPPFTQIELQYFRQSTRFMERFNKHENLHKAWVDSRLQLVEANNFN